MCFYQHTSAVEHVQLEQVKGSLVVHMHLATGPRELFQTPALQSSQQLQVPKKGGRNLCEHSGFPERRNLIELTNSAEFSARESCGLAVTSSLHEHAG